MTELKPCPFCGGNAKYFRSAYEDDIADVEYVGCPRCEAVSPLFYKKGQSIEWWNRRANPWHTGTPTEEGWYLVQHLSDAEYCGSKFFVARWDGEKFIINPRPPIVVTYPNGTAWQKITPYVEANT